MADTLDRRKKRRRQYYADRIMVNGRLIAPQGIHGVHSTYRNRGCRCELCSTAHRQRVARDRTRRHERTEANGGIAPTSTHGTNTYGNWRCRCEVCVTAWNTRIRGYRTSGEQSNGGSILSD